MTYDQFSPLSAANLIGNVDVPRNILPTIRTPVRRNDPDGVSSAPYYPSVAGSSLRVNYTIEVATVVTPHQEDIALSSNSLATIISEINAVDPTNLKAVDLDGFLALQNLNPGKTHSISVASFGHAAGFLGFAIEGQPGGISYAGEIAAAPGQRNQGNPQTTALVTKNEGLSDKSFNRGMAAVLQMVENIRVDMARDVIAYKDVALTFAAHPITVGRWVARINDDTLRLFYHPVDGVTAKDLEPYFRVLDASSKGQAISTAANFPHVQVVDVYYATNATALDPTQGFAAWGTPDGTSINRTGTPNKDKVAATAISSIKGNIIHCSANFNTAKVKPGDPVELVASNLQPFDHSGWWAVDAVIDDNRIAVRPMTISEAAEYSPNVKNRPRFLNEDAGGTVRVAVGRFIPAGDLWLELNDNTITNAIVRIPVGVPLRELAIDQQGAFPGGLQMLTQRLYDHMVDAVDAHAASAIGTVVLPTWADGLSSSGANLSALLTDIINHLKVTTGQGGIGKIGGGALTIGGAAPNNIPANPLYTQLLALLTLLRDHINDGVAHAGAGAVYSGSPAWADGTTVPAGITIDSAIDQVVADLADISLPNDGAGRIGIFTYNAWLGGRTNPTTNVRAAINKIISDLGAITGNDDGAERIGAQGTTELLAGSVRSQLDEIATNWAKLSRANTFSQEQTLNGTAADTTAAIKTTYVPSVRKLLWEAALESSGAGGTKVRLYAGRNDVDLGYEIAVNARWDGANWNRDEAGNASRLVVTRSGAYLQTRLAGDATPWTDTLGNWHTPLFLGADKPAAAIGMGPSVTPKNVARCWANFTTDFDLFSAPTFALNDGFNVSMVTSTSGGNAFFDVTFVTALADTNYIVLPQTEVSAYAWMPFTVENKTVNGFRLYPRHPTTLSKFTDFSGGAGGVGAGSYYFAVFGA